MRVLLVYSLRDARTLKRPLATLGDIHIGLSYISAALKARGHSTRLVVLSSEMADHSLAMAEAAVVEFQPGLIAFTAVSTQFAFISRVARRLKERWPDRYQLIGGVHVSLQPEEALAGPFDALCIGEGELAAAELADQLMAGQRPRGISNLWFKGPDGTVEKNDVRDFEPDLDRFPSLDREIWQEWILASRQTRQVVQPGRGCPYNCGYCSNHALRKLAGGKYVRLRKPAAILAEIRAVKARYPETTEIYLQSETIAVDLKWLAELADEIENFNRDLNPKVEFTCNFRIARQFLSEDVFGALRRANVRTIEIGLESGSERVRKEVLRRHYTNDDFFQAVALAREHGMRVNVYNMIGLPGETVAEHQETVAVNRQACPDSSMTSIFFPYPGTDLYELCRQQGRLDATGDQTAERTRATLDQPQFSRAQVQRAYDWFEWRIYQGRRPLHFRLRKVLRNKIISRAWSHFVFMRLLPLWQGLRQR